jgi:Domain of unknown function (DUF6371)
MTRHISSIQCFVSRQDAKCLMDIKRQVSREIVSEMTLDYSTLAEIERSQKNGARKEKLENLMTSDDLFDRSKGYGLRLLDSIKGKIDGYAEGIQDVKPSKEFFAYSNSYSHGTGRVVEVKEEALAEKVIEPPKDREVGKEGRGARLESKWPLLSAVQKEKLQGYYNKVEKASALHAIVKSEVSSSGISNERAPSFHLWQKACSERNEEAYRLLSSTETWSKILGKQSLEILREQSARYEASLQRKPSIESQLIENIDRVLYRLFPEGPQRRDSRGFRFGTKGSLAVICAGEKKGCYYDHENKEGGSLLQLIQKKEGLGRKESLEWCARLLEDQRAMLPSQFSLNNFKKGKEDGWISLMPPEGHSLPDMKVLSKYFREHYVLNAKYPYYNQNGDIVCYNLRLEPKDGSKAKLILPLSYGKTNEDDQPKWSFKKFKTEKELLYNSNILKKYPKKPVLIVEGEKSADAGNRLLGKDYIVITWFGGSGAAKNGNWEQLFGRNVVIWPDNDGVGYKASEEISACLRNVGVASLKVVSRELLKELPEKWDIADPLPPNTDVHFIRNSILRAESRAVGLEHLTKYQNTGLSLRDVNEVLARVDTRLRSGLENEFGTRTWLVEEKILSSVEHILTTGVREIEKRVKTICANPSEKEKLVLQGIFYQAESNNIPSLEQLVKFRQGLQAYVVDASPSLIVEGSKEIQKSHQRAFDVL